MLILIEIFNEAWISIKSYKLRSFLTILGIIIGVAAVVVMISVGVGVQNNVNKQLSGLGANLLKIRPGSERIRGFHSGNVQTLTYEDADVIANLSVIKKVAYANNSTEQIVYGNQNQSNTIYGVSLDYFNVNNMELQQGEFLSTRNLRHADLVAVVGANIVEDLLETEMLGKILRIKNVPFQVIGVLKKKGASFGPRSVDDQIFIPFSTLSKRIMGSKYPKSINELTLQVTDAKYLNYAERKVAEVLRVRHKLKNTEENDFRIMNLTEIKDTLASTTKMFTILLAAIASISLLVGSIGIMNMMLVSVTERTREIGLRKAIGAPEKTILQQFLFESLLISFLGSLMGLISGLMISKTLSYFLNMEMPISLFSIILPIIISIIVGIVSGLFPAVKAAKLNPIDALRYE